MTKDKNIYKKGKSVYSKKLGFLSEGALRFKRLQSKDKLRHALQDLEKAKEKGHKPDIKRAKFFVQKHTRIIKTTSKQLGVLPTREGNPLWMA